MVDVAGNGDGEAGGVVAGYEPAPEPLGRNSPPPNQAEMDIIIEDDASTTEAGVTDVETEPPAIAPPVDESKDAQLVEDLQPEEESQLAEVAESDILYTYEDKKQDYVPGEDLKPTKKAFEPLPPPDPKAIKSLERKLQALQKKAQDMTLSFVWFYLS